MKKIIALTLVLFLFFIPGLFAQTKQVNVKVDGLSCPFCAYGLEKKIKKIDGIENLKIDVEKGMMTFTVAKEKTVSEDEIKKKVKDAGFTPREITYTEIPEKKE